MLCVTKTKLNKLLKLQGVCTVMIELAADGVRQELAVNPTESSDIDFVPGLCDREASTN
jgi:hypothetical protein